MSAKFLTCVVEWVSERESMSLGEGLNTKVKIDIYKLIGKSVEFKKNSHVMQEVDFCLSISQICMVLMKSWVSIEERKVKQHVFLCESHTLCEHSNFKSCKKMTMRTLNC